MNKRNIPFQMHLEHDNQGRIIRKAELVLGREPRDLRYMYDEAGRLTEVHDAAEEWGPVERYAYDKEGRRISAVCINQEPVRQELVYTKVNGETRLKAHNDWLVLHDENGFRWGWCPNGCEEQWVYSRDYKLLQVLREDERGSLRESIEFDHDRNGQRDAKFLNRQKIEVYDWYDLIRLDAVATRGQDISFWYNEGERVPYAATLNGEHELYLYYDQVGSLRVVADKYGRVVKEIRYSAFGVIEEDTNPDLYMPIGFAGGLHDRDVGFVRFGFRDYDPVTARFTAKDPLGYAAGDLDLYGYCFDDPVNREDPTGLIAPLALFGAGKLLSMGIAGIGSYMAAGTADTAGHATKEDYGEDGRTAAEAVNAVGPKVAAIQAGSAVASPAPAAVVTAPQWGPAAATAGTILSNPERVSKAGQAAGEFMSGAIDQGPPPMTISGGAGYVAGKIGEIVADEYKDRKRRSTGR